MPWSARTARRTPPHFDLANDLNAARTRTSDQSLARRCVPIRYADQTERLARRPFRAGAGPVVPRAERRSYDLDRRNQVDLPPGLSAELGIRGPFLGPLQLRIPRYREFDGGPPALWVEPARGRLAGPSSPRAHAIRLAEAHAVTRPDYNSGTCNPGSQTTTNAAYLGRSMPVFGDPSPWSGGRAGA